MRLLTDPFFIAYLLDGVYVVIRTAFLCGVDQLLLSRLLLLSDTILEHLLLVVSYVRHHFIHVTISETNIMRCLLSRRALLFLFNHFSKSLCLFSLSLFIIIFLLRQSQSNNVCNKLVSIAEGGSPRGQASFEVILGGTYGLSLKVDLPLISNYLF